MLPAWETDGKCPFARVSIGGRYGESGARRVARTAGAYGRVPAVGDAMEMHQVRYFLAVARTLNFTRAAEECNVAQPSLTRAIRQLEGELGGDLFRRERP